MSLGGDGVVRLQDEPTTIVHPDILHLRLDSRSRKLDCAAQGGQKSII
jgi:hypothetical protein